MNIRTEQIDALLQQQELSARKPVPGTGEGFAAALAQQLGTSETDSVQQLSVPPLGAQNGIISQMLIGGTENTAAGDDMETITQQAFHQASGALDMWDSYTGTLGATGGADMRQAYNLLQGLDSQVAALKQRAQPVLGQNPGLANVITDLEVMTATEKFKFNRGDYN